MDMMERIADLEARLSVAEMLVTEALARGFPAEAELRDWASGVLEQITAAAEVRGDDALTARFRSAWEQALALAVRQHRQRQSR